MARTVLVTGVNRGLGLEIAKQLKARGDHVIGTVRDPKKDADAKAHVSELLALEATDPASLERLGAALKGRAIDVLINNAAITTKDASVANVTIDDIQKVLTTNVAGPLVLTKTLLPNLRTGRGKQVLNISSTLGSIANARGGFSYSYCASKSALNMVTAQLANELGKEGFTCVTFCPGWNKTDMGGPQAPLDPKDSMASLLRVVDGLTTKDNGKYLSHEGNPIAW
jgi:NAD(P)-dependent dehydrogenase (short-subunit alcohol dehydrogenase family)